MSAGGPDAAAAPSVFSAAAPNTSQTPGPFLLPYLVETVGDGEVGFSGCERRATELREARSGRVFFAGCGAWVCPVCGPNRARKLSEAIAWTQPEVFGRLSLMPDTFDLTRGQMRDLRRRLAAKYGPVEWAWVRHRNPKLTGYHVHFLGRLPWIPQRELQAMTGGRIPWIQKARQELGSSDYLLGVRERRGASGYLLKRAAGPEFYGEHLALNGGRGVHWSREFFRDPVAGDVVGVGEALHRVKRSRPGRGLWYRPGGVEPLDPRKAYRGPPTPLGDLTLPEPSAQTALTL
jgi:hypothetical protein